MRASLGMVGAGLLLLATAVAGVAQGQPGAAIYTAEIDGIIHPVAAEYVREVISRADAAGAGLVLALSAFTDWYAGSGVGVKLAVIGWHTGVLGKLVFFVGLAVLALAALREVGFELSATVPESLLVLALGAVATIFVLIRVISIPDSVLPADGRGIGIWISLIAAVGVIGGGLLRAAEEL